MGSMDALVAAIRSGDYQHFVHARYKIAGEGAAIAVKGHNFTGASLRRLPLQFLLFIDCDLHQASLKDASVLSVGFLRCNLQGIDLRGCKGVIDAESCDLSGALWNNATQLGSTTDADASTFAGCEADAELRNYLTSQGVDFPQHLSPQRKAMYQEAGSW
jgi:hypothetical protein